MKQDIQKIIEHTVPFITAHVRSKDLHIFLSGGKALQYPEATNEFVLDTVHRGTMRNRWAVNYPERPDIKLVVNAIPIRRMSGDFGRGFMLGKLAPLGELVYTSNGRCADYAKFFTNSQDYVDALSVFESFNCSYFARTENIGYFYSHVYARLVAERTRTKGVVGVGCAIPLLEMANNHSETLRNELEQLIEDQPELVFEDFIGRALSILERIGVKLTARYDIDLKGENNG